MRSSAGWHTGSLRILTWVKESDKLQIRLYEVRISGHIDSKIPINTYPFSSLSSRFRANFGSTTCWAVRCQKRNNLPLDASLERHRIWEINGRYSQNDPLSLNANQDEMDFNDMMSSTDEFMYRIPRALLRVLAWLPHHVCCFDQSRLMSALMPFWIWIT